MQRPVQINSGRTYTAAGVTDRSPPQAIVPPPSHYFGAMSATHIPASCYAFAHLFQLNANSYAISQRMRRTYRTCIIRIDVTSLVLWNYF